MILHCQEDKAGQSRSHCYNTDSMEADCRVHYTDKGDRRRALGQEEHVVGFVVLRWGCCLLGGEEEVVMVVVEFQVV